MFQFSVVLFSFVRIQTSVILTNVRYNNIVRLALYSTMVFLLVCGKYALDIQQNTHKPADCMLKQFLWSLFFLISRCSFFAFPRVNYQLASFNVDIHPTIPPARYMLTPFLLTTFRATLPFLLHPSHTPLPIFHHPLTEARFKNSQGWGVQNCQNVTSHHRLRNSESQ
jgi:hypothetical protein